MKRRQEICACVFWNLSYNICIAITIVPPPCSPEGSWFNAATKSSSTLVSRVQIQSDLTRVGEAFSYLNVLLDLLMMWFLLNSLITWVDVNVLHSSWWDIIYDGRVQTLYRWFQNLNISNKSAFPEHKFPFLILHRSNKNCPALIGVSHARNFLFDYFELSVFSQYHFTPAIFKVSIIRHAIEGCLVEDHSPR